MRTIWDKIKFKILNNNYFYNNTDIFWWEINRSLRIVLPVIALLMLLGLVVWSVWKIK